MLGIRLSSLRIEAFRGISTPLFFDVRAPITLVFAPNGTGKTTICEAVEWLLTGQVERLKEGKDFNASVLRSKFAHANQVPHVEADLFVGKQTHYLSRIVEGTTSPARLGSQKTTAVAQGPHELLSVLAPAAAASEAHHLTAISLRQRWLKGTRFLSAEALAALVDTDDETIERRAQVFADLLGIRHLLDAERQCGRYVSELSTRLRALAPVIARQSFELSALDQAIAGANGAGVPGMTSARAEAGMAEALLESLPAPSLDDSTSLDHRLEALSAIYRRRRFEHEQRSRAVQQVEAQWGSRIVLERVVKEGHALETALSSELAEIEKLGRSASAVLSARIAERQVTAERVQALAAGRDRLARLSVALLSAIRQPVAAPPVSRTLGELSEATHEATWTAESRRERRAELTQLSAALARDEREGERLRLIDEEISRRSPTLVSEEVLAELRIKVIDAEVRARESLTLFDGMAGPVARLQAAARDLLAHDHGLDAQTCPVCAHDWESTGQLRAAIATALNSVPEIVGLAEAKTRDTSEAARAARNHLDNAMNAHTQVAALARERDVLLGASERLRQDIKQLGLPAEDTADAIAIVETRLDIADALSNLRDALDALTPALSGNPASLLPDETPLSDLLARLHVTFAAREQDVQLSLATMVKAIEEASGERERLRSRHAATQQRLRECRESLRGKGAELAALRALWEGVALGTAWSDMALATLKQDLADEAKLLSRAEAHIEAARGAWDFESRRKRRDELVREIQPLLDRQKRMTVRIAAASRARAVFHDTYTTISRQQVRSLGEVVNPLFARMHANRVFDRINLGKDSDFLRWLADAGDVQLDPGKDFSQGQRQDLALALFLARARTLGGTFFLDEPVTHLDDLNRVGLLDILRATTLEGSQGINLVITTSSRSLARHLVEKFAGISTVETPEGRLHPLKVVELDGNGRTGIELRDIYPQL